MRKLLLLLCLVSPLQAQSKWTARIVDSTKTDTAVNVVVEFTDGTTTRTVPFQVNDPSTIPTLVKNQIDQYDRILGTAVSPGPVALPTPPAQPQPSAAELAARQFREDLFLYRMMQNAVALTLIPANDPMITSQLAKLKATFKPEYLSYLNAP